MGSGYLTTYIALEGLELHWTASEIKTVMELWLEGHSLEFMAQVMDRQYDDLSLLVIDLATKYQHFFPPRPKGLAMQQSIPWDKKRERLVKIVLTSFEKENGYDVFLEMDMFWEDKAVYVVQDYWNKGYSLEEISKATKRKAPEVMLLLLDRLLKGAISERDNGIEGSKIYGNFKRSVRKSNKRAS